MKDDNDTPKTKDRIRRRRPTNPPTAKPLYILPQNKNIEPQLKIDKESRLEQKYAVEVGEYLVQDLIDEERSKVTIKEAVRAIVQADGYITRAARKLKVNYQTLRRLVEKTPKLKQLIEDVTESTLDLAESKLKQQMVAGNLSAIIFHLKCKGRHRGWVEDADKAAAFKENRPIQFNYKHIQSNQDATKFREDQEARRVTNT